MRHGLCNAAPRRGLHLALAGGLLLIASSAVADRAPRVHLLPRFTSGLSLRYQIDTRMNTSGKTTSPIANPEGASVFKQTSSLLIRLDVLDVKPAAPGARGTMTPVRLRATYEKSSAISESDAYDPEAAALQEQYGRLEGRSMEFTLESDGKISDITGLDDMISNPSATQTVRSWMSGLSSGAGFPKQGIIVGQKWSNEQPLTGTPLSGLIWHTDSTYLRDEACPATGPRVSSAASAPPSAVDVGMCAVILTRFEIIHRSARGDPTPEDYRHNGLRTTGTWTGTGQSLDSISLVSGFVVSSTQTSTQDMDFEITSARSGSRLQYKGRVESQSDILLLPQSPPAP
jgi:hypothetical protein